MRLNRVAGNGACTFFALGWTGLQDLEHGFRGLQVGRDVGIFRPRGKALGNAPMGASAARGASACSARGSG